MDLGQSDSGRARTPRVAAHSSSPLQPRGGEDEPAIQGAPHALIVPTLSGGPGAYGAENSWKSEHVSKWKKKRSRTRRGSSWRALGTAAVAAAVELWRSERLSISQESSGERGLESSDAQDSLTSSTNDWSTKKPVLPGAISEDSASSGSRTSPVARWRR
jgi:hypothetical protein